ncbi:MULTISPECIES: ATP synthase subunit I [unclassified Marinobacter]|uniref:ATP synthase subunit I n=1 Tax=unclassified Marinobacter TaxID=83889 RepID=UPI0026E48A09|nr:MULTISPECIES: ATP synthase subunit I [unclassified Marinobacter]MDO6443283.1 ATP synthase subunit I [Marinobacter sp. 2_MG-2023]MDO6824319.1 ATP synthase subunit I [Marinobacter sp. 1_MG-2023]
MITVDWHAVLLGFSVGAPVSALFFAGLAWGMRHALNSGSPATWLMISAFGRIAMLLALGFWITAMAGSNWAIAGYALAFFLIRLIAVLWARTGRSSVTTEQEST